ncbi:MAG: hypothetical protein ACTSWR_01675 [Candidatus Helarchaeota archaeon]
MKKYALSLHHFNTAYVVGDTESYHRHTIESLALFLNFLFENPKLKCNLEINGYSLEFIYKNYPYVFEKLKFLIDNEQIELISTTYSPQLWIAFPKTDMIKSLRYNFNLLKRLGLKQSRIFFAQENFFYEGIKYLKEWFDIAIIKDDYYFHFYNYQDKNNLTRCTN